MSELLTRVHAEIRERLEQRRTAVHEYERLAAALVVLGGLSRHTNGAKPADAPARPAAPAAPAPAPTTAAPRRAKGASRRPRAPHGANRAAVLQAARERPGASAGELAAASGVSRAVVYAVLKTLTERGELVRHELPGGAGGYALPPEPAVPGWSGDGSADGAEATVQDAGSAAGDDAPEPVAS